MHEDFCGYKHSVITNFPSQLLPIYCGNKPAVQSLTDFSLTRGGSLLTRLETSHISIKVVWMIEYYNKWSVGRNPP
jgi:hypothetical protein